MMVKVIEHARKENLMVLTEEVPSAPLTVSAMTTKRIRYNGQSRRMTVFRDSEGQYWINDNALS
jgi:hypothetical protein